MSRKHLLRLLLLAKLKGKVGDKAALLSLLLPADRTTIDRQMSREEQLRDSVPAEVVPVLDLLTERTGSLIERVVADLRVAEVARAMVLHIAAVAEALSVNAAGTIPLAVQDVLRRAVQPSVLFPKLAS